MEVAARTAGLLDAVTDRRKLVREVLATGVRRVEVRLDDEREAAADDAIAVLALERGLHARHSLVRYALHQTNIEFNLVPFDDSALDLEDCARAAHQGECRERGARRGHGDAQGRPTVVCQFCGDFKIRLLSVSRIFVFCPA